MRRLAWLVLAVGCLPPRERQPDPWDRYVNAGVPPGNVRVRLETYEFAAEDRTAFDAAVRLRDPGVVVTGGGTGGLTVFAGASDFRASFRARTERYRSRRSSERFVLVADGYEAQVHAQRIRMVPVTVAVPVYGGIAGVRTVAGVVTGSGLVVRPKTLPDGRMDVILTPWVSVEEGGRARTIRATELRTRLTVEVGRPVVLMADRERTDAFASAFLGFRSTSGERRQLMVLVVEK